MSTLRAKATLRGHRGSVMSVAFSSDSKTLASAAADGTIRLWNPATGKQTGLLDPGATFANSVALSHNGQFLASGHADGTVRLWNLLNREQRWALGERGESIHSVAFSPDSKLLASATQGGSIAVWDVPTRKQVKRLTSPAKKVTFFPSGKFLLAGPQVWEVPGWSERLFWGAYLALPSVVSFSSNGEFVAAWGLKLDGDLTLLEERPASSTTGRLRCSGSSGMRR
jgi:WD40 repeat protein